MQLLVRLPCTQINLLFQTPKKPQLSLIDPNLLLNCETGEVQQQLQAEPCSTNKDKHHRRCAPTESFTVDSNCITQTRSIMALWEVTLKYCMRLRIFDLTPVFSYFCFPVPVHLAIWMQFHGCTDKLLPALGKGPHSRYCWRPNTPALHRDTPMYSIYGTEFNLGKATPIQLFSEMLSKKGSSMTSSSTKTRNLWLQF